MLVLAVVSSLLAAGPATADPSPKAADCLSLAAGSTGLLFVGDLPAVEPPSHRPGGFGPVASAAVRDSLPARVVFKDQATTFSRFFAFALRDGRIYVRRARVGMPVRGEPWHVLELPACLDGQVTAISADGELLLADWSRSSGVLKRHAGRRSNCASLDFTLGAALLGRSRGQDVRRRPALGHIGVRAAGDVRRHLRPQPSADRRGHGLPDAPPGAPDHLHRSLAAVGREPGGLHTSPGDLALGQPLGLGLDGLRGRAARRAVHPPLRLRCRRRQHRLRRLLLAASAARRRHTMATAGCRVATPAPAPRRRHRQDQHRDNRT